MENPKPQAKKEQLEHHSLPGINMAGKEAPCECNSDDEESRSPRQGDDDTSRVHDRRADQKQA
jgi:hypothetical protein